MIDDAKQPSAADLKAVSKLLRFFDADVAVGQWSDRRAAMPFLDYREPAQTLIEALYAHRFIVIFDWSAWANEAERYLNEPNLIQSAPILDVARLFTTIVRRDRFCEGTFKAEVDSGVIRALLRRVNELANG